MAKQSPTTKVLRSIKRNQPESRVPVGSGIYLPNHSGDHGAGIIKNAPVKDTDIVNKVYIDDNAVLLSGENQLAWTPDPSKVTNLNSDRVDDLHVATSGSAIADMSAANTWSGIQTFNANVDINGNDLILDIDGDTTLKSSTDDTPVFTLGTGATFTINQSGTALQLNAAGNATAVFYQLNGSSKWKLTSAGGFFNDKFGFSQAINSQFNQFGYEQRTGTAATNALYIAGQNASTGASGSNRDGGDVRINGGADSGSGVDGDIILQSNIEIDPNGALVYTGSNTSGIPYGEIYVKDNSTATTLNSAAKVQITDFATDGHELNMDADQGTDDITVQKAGIYFIAVSISIENRAAQAHVVEIGLWKNNGSTQFNNIHGHRQLSAGGGDQGSMSLSGIVDLAANDTLELWADTNSGSNRDVVFEDVTLSAFMLGGT